ncbi:MAG: Protein-disulfide reductase [Myxococcales bacterium]|nr:Protein-disulfide reductase [Myxococcales bacterium]
MSGSNLFAHGWVWAFASVFLGGFLTSLTPCVYPLIPITMSIFGARDEHVSRGRALLLATSYVGGIAVMYTALGVSAALAGRQFGTFMGNAWFIVPIVALFIIMAASMFGAFEMSLPTSLQTRLSTVGGKGFSGAFAMGLVGGIIAAPCTGPVLASVLAYVATTRSVTVGGSLLFTYALGMGPLFFAIAGFSVALPKSGRWMESVKSIFGVVMLVAALYFLRNIVASLGHYGRPTWKFLEVNLALVVAGVILGGVQLSFHDGAFKVLRKATGIVLIVAGLFGVVAWTLTAKPLDWTYGEKVGVAAARSAHKPVLLDFFADWCIPCKELDVKTFGKPEVADELRRFQLVKVDCSNDDDPIVNATKDRYGASTLPTVVLLDSDGKIVTRFNKAVTPEELLPALKQVH